MTSTDPFATRYERHFGDRVIRCYQHRVVPSPRRSARPRLVPPTRTVWVCEGERLSYADVDARTHSLAGSLSRRACS